MTESGSSVYKSSGRVRAEFCTRCNLEMRQEGNPYRVELQ